ncbi:MAG: FtsW/RodA/SpoVE family cell cycle protein, partial [Thermodesulfobacteriota bacterium]|nr:FtsW/RodA/SpoVE family cell cycle protein [Thermodesulfobacteriota bacterium]
MNSLSSKTKKTFFPNLRVVLPLVILSIIGVITLLSTTILPKGGFGDLEIVYKQILFVIVGIVLFLLLSKINLTYLKHWQVMTIIYVLTLSLLLITFFFAPTINYVRRWLVIAGIQIQPSEIAKVVVILYTALILSKKDTYNEWLLF